MRKIICTIQDSYIKPFPVQAYDTFILLTNGYSSINNPLNFHRKHMFTFFFHICYTNNNIYLLLDTLLGLDYIVCTLSANTCINFFNKQLFYYK